MNIVVSDTTDFLGRRLTRALQASGHSTQHLLCDDHGRFGRWNGAGVVPFASTDILDGALQGAAVAFLLCPQRPSALDSQGRFTAAASRAGLRAAVVVTQGAGNPADHGVARSLRNAGVPVLAVGVAPIFTIGAPLFETVRYLVERLPVIPCLGWMNTPIQPIAADDVVAALIGLAGNGLPAAPACLTGPESTNFQDLLRRYAAMRGLPRSLIALPVDLPSLSARALARITPVKDYECRGLIERISAPCSGLACIQGRTAFSETLRGAVHAERPPAVRSTRAADLNRPEHQVIRRDGFIIGLWETIVAAEPQHLFAVVERIGGEQGWYFADELWQVRGLLDRAVGGVGLNRSRRDPRHLAVGDTFDFWRVEQVDPPTRLTLRAEMKMPGRAWLEFQCVARNARHTLLRTVVWYEPKGLLGEAYWTALYPFHVLIFDGMHREIAVRACHVHSLPAS